MKEKLKLRDENGKIYFGWWVVLLAALMGSLVYNGIISTSGLFLIPVTTELGIPVASFSAYVSILSLTNIVVLFFISKKINRNNIKKLMFAALLSGIVGFNGFFLAKSIVQFYFFSVFLGFSFAAATMTPCTILVTNWFGEKIRGRAMSIYMGGVSLIGIVFMNVINYIVVHFGWQIGYLSLAICIALCIPFVLKIAVWGPEDKGIKRMGELEEGEKTAMEASSRQLTGYTFKEGMKKPIVWISFIACIFIVLASSAILQHGVPTVVMAGYSQTYAVFLSTMISAALIVSTIIVGWITDKAGLWVGTFVTSIGFTLAALGYAFMADMPVLVYPAILAYVFGVPAVNLISPLVVTHICGEKEAPRFIGYVNIFIGIGGIFGALIVGALFDLTGAYKVPWLIMTIILAAALVMRAIVTTKKCKYSEEHAEELAAE
ncbi:MAG: MFS transporter [Bilifractor sp.]